MPKNQPIKKSRLSIRVDTQRKAIIARAAKQHGDTISDFVLENAYQVATELLADEGTISLSKKQLAHIFETLDHPPPKSAAAVRKLLSERTILLPRCKQSLAIDAPPQFGDRSPQEPPGSGGRIFELGSPCYRSTPLGTSGQDLMQNCKSV